MHILLDSLWFAFQVQKQVRILESHLNTLFVTKEHLVLSWSVSDIMQYITYWSITQHFINQFHPKLNIKSLQSIVEKNYSLPLNNMGLSCTGPVHLQVFFSSKYYHTTWPVVGWIHGCDLQTQEELYTWRANY